jgi:cobalt-zinc-cadmium efflux system membrane fusion protein
MNHKTLIQLALSAGLALVAAGCGKKADATKNEPSATGPVSTTVQPDMDANHFKVDHPERFPLATAGEYVAAPELNVTGTVNPDVATQVPVPSLATGKIVEIDARLGDEVKKGQLLFKVRSSDIAGAFSDYRKAVKNEELTKVQLNRTRILFDAGAVPQSLLEIAQNAEDNSIVDLDTTAERLRLLNSDLDHPTGIVDVNAPISGVITDQQITNAAGIQALSLPAPFTISDLSHVWIICDVYENDLARVQLGDVADVRLNAYPDRVFKGRVSNIGQIMDPNIRSAKVRLEVDNPHIMRVGMFVTATFQGPVREAHATVPTTAVLHLRDREWVYLPVQNGNFQRLEVTAGKTLPGNVQEILTGLKPGARVVSNALVFQNTVEQ